MNEELDDLAAAHGPDSNLDGSYGGRRFDAFHEAVPQSADVVFGIFDGLEVACVRDPDQDAAARLGVEHRDDLPRDLDGTTERLAPFSFEFLGLSEEEIIHARPPTPAR
jgi:hypothetical protein